MDKIFVTIFLAFGVFGIATVNANEQDISTSELYNGLLPKEQSALCAVSAIMIEPKDEPMSKLHLKHFREKAKVLPIFSDGMLIAMGKKWIVDNGLQIGCPMFMRSAKAK